MKRLRIYLSSIAPNINSIWLKKGTLYYFSDGWKPITSINGSGGGDNGGDSGNPEKPENGPSSSEGSNPLASIGYSDLILKTLLLEDVNYSNLQKEKYISKEIQSFSNDNKLVYPPLVSVPASNDLTKFYYKSENILSIPLLNTSKVLNMTEMCAYCYNLYILPELDTSELLVMDSIFYNCKSLQEWPGWDTSKVTSTSWAFSGCTALTKVDNFNMERVTNANNMFNGASSLLYVGELNTKSTTYFKKMFAECTNLNTIKSIDFISATDIFNIFYNCNNLKNMVIKNIGYSPLEFYNLSECTNWGVGNPDCVVKSLLLFSANRVSLALPKVTIRLSTTTEALLEPGIKLEIMDRGYDIVAY